MTRSCNILKSFDSRYVGAFLVSRVSFFSPMWKNALLLAESQEVFPVVDRSIDVVGFLCGVRTYLCSFFVVQSLTCFSTCGIVNLFRLFFGEANKTARIRRESGLRPGEDLITSFRGRGPWRKAFCIILLDDRARDAINIRNDGRMDRPCALLPLLGHVVFRYKKF